ncbi:helix-turn-helix domain-containing protein [Burkholderia cenocepacia]|uniref:helix-turn-helix domain-containing protein n=1 Tax=Burkholderia cenocepacia TaxID=95486 RepID=UPI002230B6FE|nr:AraC family transcriptional regulator [Burkholderia cenocepacia]MCW3503600.1 AraC family transcriptional regulator [Burkholderia cenocepacia]MCW3510963.1 AraC family transcriptional regulator [Burkholderia cenocepacia]MCW3518787.1 AraC family transcriptional regulator [Burkholderia cenocepacia]MCW3533936.1 AraC family transcriptional regulator [Burkholderia cenocepacia]MCW3549118.1 AraC family transcriptional regulator [Burkholderia cenocepacia]
MNQINQIPTFRFSTTDFPKEDRFDSWRSQLDGMLNLALHQSPDIYFDLEVRYGLLGSILVGERRWLNPSARTIYQAHRSQSMAAADDLDCYILRLNLNEVTYLLDDGGVVESGELIVMDTARSINHSILSGDSIYMIIPRSIIGENMLPIQSRILRGVVAGILSDFMRSLAARLQDITSKDVQHVSHATAEIVRACLFPSKDNFYAAEAEIQAIQKNRVHRYIDAHILDPALSVDAICKDVGISRASLYRLFDLDKGVMHVIQKRRLHLAHKELTNAVARRARIGDVAERFGFSSAKNFGKAFKNLYGYAPREAYEYAVEDRKILEKFDCQFGGDRIFNYWIRSVVYSIRGMDV